jgi:hypothetical protein
MPSTNPTAADIPGPTGPDGPTTLRHPPRSEPPAPSPAGHGPYPIASAAGVPVRLRLRPPRKGG